MYRILTAGLLSAATVGSATTLTVPDAAPPPAPAASTAATPAASTAGTLKIALEIHVENSADPAAELATIEQMAAAADLYDIDLTFSLDETMLEHVATAPAVVTDRLHDMELAGHQFGLHADVAAMNQRAATLHIADMAADFRSAFGHTPASLSGACTASGDWIAAARASGISTIAGTVLYCERTLRTAAYAGTEYASEIATAKAVCTRPSVAICHDPAPQATEARRVMPWRADDAYRWLTPSGRRSAMKIVPTLGHTSMECASEGESGSCAFDAVGDAAAFVALAVQADTLSGGAAGATLHMAWSTNERPDSDYISDVLAEIADTIAAAGVVDWVTLAAV